ncbi:MAG: abortive infection system antitoxin AbiGi family protein [Planctomycetaceae bacterium]
MRPDFLVHWTGKDLGLDPTTLTDADRNLYIDRLAATLIDGLWMTKPSERIEGNAGAYIQYESPMTCFTEIRLSQTQSHSRRYGLLGIGVTRRFVLDRLGGPVHYVRNHSTECVIGNAQEILNVLKSLDRPEIVEYFSVNSAFIKNMSDLNQDDFTYLNEQEWRIVHTYKQVTAGKLVDTGVPHPPFRIPLQSSDVRLIVFPDGKTRMKARSDSRLGAWLQASAPAGPILLTIQECEHF